MDTNTIIKQAIEAIKQGNKSNARTLLEDVIKNEPNNEEALFVLAHVAQTQEQARTYLERVININPNNERAKQQLEKLLAVPSNKQLAPQTARAKESKVALYTLLGSIITLLFAIILLLVGIWLKQDSNQSTTSSPALVSTTASSTTKTISIPKWEYIGVYTMCDAYGANCTILGLKNPQTYPDRGSILDELGGQGWELIYANSTSTGDVEYILKRPIIEK